VIAGTDLPALGFGMGDVVLRELLSDRGLLPTTSTGVDYYLVAVEPAQRPALLALAHQLREAGHSVEYALRPQAVGRQFKNAAAAGARRVVTLGPDEVARGEVAVKDLESGEERRVPLAELGWVEG
jgi:histidyl-tRNA synthetase